MTNTLSPADHAASRAEAFTQMSRTVALIVCGRVTERGHPSNWQIAPNAGSRMVSGDRRWGGWASLCAGVAPAGRGPPVTPGGPSPYEASEVGVVNEMWEASFKMISSTS